jgi:N-methylhydantoinase B
MVQRDAIDGKVSLESARRDYGVVLDGPDIDVDPVETSRLRDKMSAERGAPPAMIERGPGFEIMTRGEAKPRMRSKT